MRYFNIYIKPFYGERIASCAEGDKIPNGSHYFWQMDEGITIEDAPVFDYFYLESFDLKKYWEWALFDVHEFIGEGSQIPGWLISIKLKSLLNRFTITTPHYFYPSKLAYKNKKYNYYIFHFAGNRIYESCINYIDYSKSKFINPLNKQIEIFKDNEEYVKNEDDLYYAIKADKTIHLKNQHYIKKTICINKSLDFFYIQNYTTDCIVSERLKNAIEENGITGFEFSDLDYEVVVEK